jgi:NAD(P)-dependent dehydrogenase (short-subunit alcohol dehydrogenase family)
MPEPVRHTPIKRNVVVTGGSRGLGLAISAKLSAAKSITGTVLTVDAGSTA